MSLSADIGIIDMQIREREVLGICLGMRFIAIFANHSCLKFADFMWLETTSVSCAQLWEGNWEVCGHHLSGNGYSLQGKGERCCTLSELVLIHPVRALSGHCWLCVMCTELQCQLLAPRCNQPRLRTAAEGKVQDFLPSVFQCWIFEQLCTRVPTPLIARSDSCFLTCTSNTVALPSGSSGFPYLLLLIWISSCQFWFFCKNILLSHKSINTVSIQRSYWVQQFHGIHKK